MKPHSTKLTFLLIFFCLAFSLGLAGYGYLGSFMRLSGDDYCYGGVVVQQGFWTAQINSYLTISTYHGGRFALTLFSGLATLFGPYANAVLPGLAITLWVLGIWFTLRQTGCRFSSRWIVPALSLLLVFTIVRQMPDRSQSLYWRSGMLPYTAPLVAGTWLTGLAAAEGRRQQRSVPGLVGIFFLAVLAGGFSETGAAFLTGWFGLGLLGCIGWIFRKKDGSGKKGFIPVCLALAGILLALLLMWVSPVTRIRQASLPSPESPLLVLSQSVKQALIYTRYSLRIEWISYLVLLLCTAAAGWVVIRQFPSRPKLSLKMVILVGFGSLAAGIFLVVLCMAPSYYAQSSPPDARALVIARWGLVLGWAGLAAIVGAWVGSWDRFPMVFEKMIPVALTAIIAAACLLPLWSAWDCLQESSRYQRWAAFWDVRDQTIRQAASQGVTSLEVVELDHIIPDVSELSPNADFWYNNCAEEYYDLSSLSADQPGWDN